jgi:anti-sigma regulatory factor (Ser/Thr protein kinase)
MNKLILNSRESELKRLPGWIGGLATHYDMPRDAAFDVELCVTELVTNVVSYAFDDDFDHEIVLLASRSQDFLQVTIEDDGKPFNPAQAPRREPSRSLDETMASGFGIHLVRSFAHQLLYERTHDKNRVTVVYSLAS